MILNKRQKLPQPRRLEQPRKVQQKESRTANVKNSSFDNPSTAVPQKKTTLDWDDISLSSEDSKSFTRFLKKGENEKDAGNNISEQKSIPAKVSFERPKTSRGSLEKAASIPKPQLSTSSALNRLAQIEARFKDRQQTHFQNKVSLSTSDFDVDVSSDSEVKRGIGKSNVRLRDKMKKKPSDRKSSTQKGQSVFLRLDNETESSEEDSESRKRFIKNVTEDYTKKTINNTNQIPDHLDQNEIFDSDMNVLKLHASTDLEESEVSLQGFMSDKVTRRSSSPKRVTFASDLVRSSDYEQSLDDFMPPSDKSEDMSSLDEVIPSKLHNIMSLDDLLPSQEVTSEVIEEERPTSALGFVGLHSVDELLPVDSTDVRSSGEFVQSLEEDIQNDSNRSSVHSSEGSIDVMQNLRSIEDLQVGSDSTQQKPKETVNVFKAKVSEEEFESEEIKSEKYSDDFVSDDDTLKETESITHDISEVSGSSVTSSVKEESLAASERSKTPVYSSSFVSSISPTSSSLTPTPPVKHRKSRKVENIETQTDVAGSSWMPGSVYADTAFFKPSRLIDNEALDVLTSYNPASLAIQDLLQQQVTLTREFVARSRRLHDLAVSTIPCDYVYGDVNLESLERLKKIWHSQETSTVSTT